MTTELFHSTQALPSLDVGEVLVELPTRHLAESLCDRLGTGFLTWADPDDDQVWVVEAIFADASALGRLLRMVEAWVAERALGAVRYHLDGKAYILSAGEITWSSFDREPVLL
jgi:hypothetical protein